MRNIRWTPWFTLGFIVLLTIGSVWVDLPGHTLDPLNWKNRVFVHKGLDLQGGLQVVLQANPPAGQSVDHDTLLGTMDTIKRRVNGLGVSEPLIQTRGSDQIVIELPGVDNPENAVRVLQQTALLEIIDPQGNYLPVGTTVTTSLGGPEQVNGAAGTPGAGTPGATPGATPTAGTEATPGATPVAGSTTDNSSAPTGPTYQTIITGADLKDAYPTTDQVGSLVVGFTLKSDAAAKFYQYTSTHIGQPMSIVVDKKVINSATIQGAISDTGQISGMNTSEVRDLSLQLKSGALAVPLEVIQSQVVGPTLGQDSIHKSVVAGLSGLTIVALFMILFYRLPGFLSVVALVIYTLLVFALFQLIPVTLTLAGIAGFILSIGMAVDANVLIFARLKEELRLGHPVARAVDAGFDHAWPSIRDSNISTMITSLILFWFGRYTGASIIQGFALTLFIGVSVSMFTAIVVTRTFLRLLLSQRWIHNQWWFGVESTSLRPGQRAVGD
ncbi:MAG: protein translocase subunit SecD [Nitrolancea sp.]